MATSNLNPRKPKPLPVPKWFKLFSLFVVFAFVITELTLQSPSANSSDYISQYVTEHKLSALQREDLTAYLAYWYAANPTNNTDTQQVREAVQQWRRTQ